MPRAGSTEYSIVKSFKYGYRNREDMTNLPAGVLVQGSQNVLTNVSGRVGITTGYELDGPASTVIAPTLSSFDYEMHTGAIRHLRAGSLTTSSNGKLQYRYVDSAGVVTWRDLRTGLTSVSFNFVDYWNTTTLQSLLLMVNGASSITEWTGGITTVASVTANTITKSGTTTWAEEGFYTTGTHSVTIGGADYQATGGWGTTTLTGVTPDPLAAGVVAGAIVHQTPETTLNSAMTSIPATFLNSLIGILRNQVYVGSLVNRSIYVSKVNNYKDYSFTSPVRIVGEGALITLDGNPIGMIPQEEAMYITAGKDQWYQTKFTLSADLAAESFEIQRLKTTTQQAAQSQAFMSKIKNSVVFLSNEPIIGSLGRVDNVVLTPQITDLSYSIINDMNSYDFTDGSIFFWRNYILVAVPQHNLIRVYNQTDPKSNYWEAPLGFPLARFSIIDGDLYGHSYQTLESYKLFTGYNFNGAPIDARALFSFQNYGNRAEDKSFNELYAEGYITPNTTLTIGSQFNLDGCAVSQSQNLVGSNTQVVCIGTDDNSLGKNSLGAAPLGANIATESSTTLPPKFRVIFTFPRQPFYEHQPFFYSVGVDYHWELVAMGNNQSLTTENNASISI